MYSFSYLEPVWCSMSSSNCCFLTYMQVSQETGQMVWYSHLFKNFPQFVVIHTVKGFGIVNKAEIDVFLELRGAAKRSYPQLKDRAETESTRMWWRRRGWEELSHIRGQGQWPRWATPHPRSGGATSSKVRSSSYALLEQPWRDTPCPR